MNLRLYLVENGISIKDFGILIGYHARYINGVMRGRYKPGKKFIKVVKDWTGIDLSEQGDKKQL